MVYVVRMTHPVTRTYRIRTGAGTVHAFVAGRTYTVRGDVLTNRPDSRFGKAVCGATTSSAAALTDDPTTCPGCLAGHPAA